MSEANPWHRLFGLTWTDFLHDTTITVETELDLSLKQQFLDLALIRKEPGPNVRPLPDGFEDLGTHNLVTFKSFWEALDAWALLELVGHFVNYRKQFSPSLRDLLPMTDFRLFAVCARYPQNLTQQVEMKNLREGVYELGVLVLPIRVIVVAQLPQKEHNALLHLLSARAELVRYGREHYLPRSRDSSSLLFKLLKAYSEEPDMSNKLKEFVRETYDEILADMPAEERLKGLTAEEVVRGLSPETLEALKRQLISNGSSAKSSDA